MGPSAPAAAGDAALIYREVREDEGEQLSAFTCRAFKQVESHILRTPKLLPADVRAKWDAGTFLVGQDASGEWMSSCYMQRTGSDVWIRFLAVPPDQRKKGLARGMMQEVERRGRELGCTHAKLVIVTVRAAELQPLYEKLGYSLTGASETVEDPERLLFPVTLLTMAKPLAT